MAKILFFLACCVLLGGLCGCAGEDRIVVYADPWAGDFTEAVAKAFEAEEGTEVELRVLSSEVILQHLHFGQPIDVAVLLDTTLIGELGVGERLGQMQSLASARVVRVRSRGKLNAGIRGAGGTVVEASHRPVRRATDAWRQTQNLPDTFFVGNFYKQTRDYLLRAWVHDGFVLSSLPRCHPDRLEVVERGPEIPGGFVASQPSTARNPSSGRAFADFLQSKKSRELLAAYHLIP